MEPGEEKWTEKLVVCSHTLADVPTGTTAHARSPLAGEAGNLLRGQLSVLIKSFRKTNEQKTLFHPNPISLLKMQIL